MALVAQFNLYLFKGGTHGERVSAGAFHGRFFIIGGVDVSFHVDSVAVGCLPVKPLTPFGCSAILYPSYQPRFSFSPMGSRGEAKRIPMVTIPTLEDMLKAGVHFGHKVSNWHPHMEPYIFTERSGVHIINLELTRKKLEEALEAARRMAAEGKTIVFVGTKKQAQDIVRQYAEQCGMPYANERWIGGLITNFGEIHKLIKKYLTLKEQKVNGELEKYTKKEQLEFEREIERLSHMVGGIATLERLPDALFVLDMRGEKTALTEATRKNVTVFGLCDTNANPARATYVIPANDDAVNSITMVASLMAEAIAEGRAEWKEKQATLAVKKDEKVGRVFTKEQSE